MIFRHKDAKTQRGGEINIKNFKQLIMHTQISFFISLSLSAFVSKNHGFDGDWLLAPFLR